MEMEKFGQIQKLGSFSVKLQEKKLSKRLSEFNYNSQKDANSFEHVFLRLLLKMLIRDGKVERARKIVKMFCFVLYGIKSGSRFDFEALC